MAKGFCIPGSLSPHAEWDKEGGIDWNSGWSGLTARDIPAFIEWLQAGPPQKQWRVIGRWDERPTAIHFNNSHIPFALEADDVEEVWE